MNARIALAGAAGVAIVALGGAAAAGWWTPWRAAYVEGIDVSHHQGAIDWRAVARSGVRFAYIKASEGGDHVDPRFLENWRGAGEAGLFRGAYHFFTLCRPGRLQAEHFLRVAPSGANALPPAVDLEHRGPCREGPSMTDTAREVRAFLDLVELRTGVRPVLYVTREFHDAHLRDLEGERFWVRSLFRRPDFREREWVLWQHHHRARRPGISGPVDLNAFRGDEAALSQFASLHELNQ